MARNWIAEGSSSTAYSVTNYIGHYESTASVPVIVNDVAVNGDQVDIFEARVPGNIALADRTKVNFLTHWPFGNDFPTASQAAHDDILARYQAMWKYYRSRGFRVCVVGPSPRGDAWTGYAAYNIEVPVAMAEITAMLGTAVDLVIDWWNDPDIGVLARNSATYYPDAVHLKNSEGHALLTSRWIKPALDTFAAKKRFVVNWNSDPVFTPPSLSSASASDVAQTTATLNVTTDKSGGRLYWVVTTVASPGPLAVVGPTRIGMGKASTIVAPRATGNQAVTSTGAKTISVTGLAASTQYYGYIAQFDDDGNWSASIATGSFTTTA